MTGIIWLVQVVQYPLFESVGREAFLRYHAGHTHLITYVVMPLMCVELCTSVGLTVYPPPGLFRVWAWIGLGLLGIVWSSTAFLQVPQHGMLAEGFDIEIYRSLVIGNWIRTAAWTARSCMFLALTARFLDLSK